jgi:dinuclear metal center YbgI/SA1388 family protein
MIARQALCDYLHDYLNCNDYQDYAPNGLQIEGRDSIQKICTAVTASADVIQQAIKLKADALLVHHGYFWRNESPIIVGMKRQRIQQLLINNLNLYAYHLPLDGHPELGNNACLGKLLKINDLTMHTALNAPRLLWMGTLPAPIQAAHLTQQLDQTFQRQPLHISGTDNLIHKIAWCSGGAQDLIDLAHSLGADAFISGEVSERTFYQAQELPIHYFACGHHATERYGIQALGMHLADKFQLSHTYIEINNPI